ncbi:cytochrome b-c1 complex subunit 8 [Toxorhynchites rutilus septentrionalis]|uniref:cytochrome b-c1 complex subunit 8 n=1 Tax=Toxorhynchites rutilus septentrionalis TaxID=329112 RepID=UPI00247A8CBD|nr:cytochrome b-c1 complex subunit 8 [Toxorhynchites rutilus septentrionalis]
MGHGFGELAKVRGIVVHKISPFEQRAFANWWTKSIPNTFRRIRSQIFVVTPPFIIGYMVYNYVENKFVQINRKNPADFENDV